MHFSLKRLKGLFRRGLDYDSSANGVVADEGGSKPSSERHKNAKMRSAKRTASAVASHSFDVARELSDVFGPLKSVVNGVGHAANVVQIARKSQKDARTLHLEVNTFRAQVETMIPDVSLAPDQVINSLVRLDKELDDIETITYLMHQDRIGSRILYWKERDVQLRAAEVKFRSAIQRFLIECNIAVILSHIHLDVKVQPSSSKGRGKEGSIMMLEASLSLEGVLKVLAFVGFFGALTTLKYKCVVVSPSSVGMRGQNACATVRYRAESPFP